MFFADFARNSDFFRSLFSPLKDRIVYARPSGMGLYRGRIRRLAAVDLSLSFVMPHTLAQLVALLTTILAAAGMGYFLAALIAAWIFLSARRKPLRSAEHTSELQS